MIAHIHYLTQERISEFPVLKQVESACKLGIKWIQYRVFPKDEKDMSEEIQTIAECCRKHGVRLIVNDFIQMALEISYVSGVHIGIQDMPVSEVRKMLGPGKIIGCSALNTDELIHFAEQGADYISIGPFKPTQTKTVNIPAIGLEGLKKYKNFCDTRRYTIPLIAAGGILLKDVRPIRFIGIHGVAVSSVINKAKHPEEIMRSFVQIQ